LILQTGTISAGFNVQKANPMMAGIPIAYPRLVFLERSLGSKFNPLVALGKSGTLGLTSFVNKFNAEAELLDDLVSARQSLAESLWVKERLCRTTTGVRTDIR